ncbi:MAG: type II toxin-antitoxin system HicB family antitoxin [Prolixibacteraceae bacterium]|jgi:predicted RNase H-like HicB family nuclease|nr:type II toxin-antitoxin system HicB family antitoxin [Prolixibacteraceae bacterium]
MKKISFTAIIEESSDGWFVGQIEEYPEVISQGKTIDELNENLVDALSLVMKTHKETTQELYLGRKTIRRKIAFI